MAVGRVAFDAYNARPISPRRVAETFIPPAHFKRLSRRAHSLVVGPRGSGKTTLMKMLTCEGLEAWDHPEADQYRELVDYTGVFIPTDITWVKQLQGLTGHDLTAEEIGKFVGGTFTVAVLRSFANALAYRLLPAEGEMPVLRRLRLSDSEQSEVVRELADAWAVDLRIESPLGLRAALGTQLSKIAQEANRVRNTEPSERASRIAANDALHLELIPALTDGLDRIEALVPETRDERWALLFDELELAPSNIKRDLLSAMRSVDDRLLFKLSISPYSAELSELRQAISAMPGHDHDEISLSYGHKEDGQAFSFDLMAAVLDQATPGRGGAPVDRLGPSDFDRGDGNGDGNGDNVRYGSGSRVAKAFDRLARDDVTFADYLAKAGVASDDLLAPPVDVRAQRIRKVMPLVILRDAYRSPDPLMLSTGRRLKTRKAPDIYRGASSMAAMLEGNPRWIISVMTSLLDAVPVGHTGRIPVPLQVVEIARTANRFRALLTAIPSSFELGRKRRGLLPFIDEIGEYFKARVLIDDFNPDPVGTFVVDSTASDAQINAIGAAVNAGVLVYIPDEAGIALLNSVRGKRFRLTYLFSPTYSLPLRVERAVSLSSILASDRTEAEARHQTLFEMDLDES